jgi:hypothetical protein
LPLLEQTVQTAGTNTYRQTKGFMMEWLNGTKNQEHQQQDENE